MTDLTAAVVAAGQERGLNHQWYFSPTLWNGPIRDLLNAAGGNAISEMTGGVSPSLFGYKVNLVNAMAGAGSKKSAGTFILLEPENISRLLDLVSLKRIAPIYIEERTVLTG